jgi:class 3 adenylate cyclase
MAIKSDLEREVAGIFVENWQLAKSTVIPDPASLKLSNDARYFERCTILYADLSGSTNLVNNFRWSFAGEIYKSFLTVSARIIRLYETTITSYDGDRIMAVFTGDAQTSNAAKCGLQINWAVLNIINPALKKQYSQTSYVVKQVVGIDTGEVRAARIGVRGDNDLVWIGRAANYAAKLTECRSDYPTWLTEQAYDKLNASSKDSNPEKKNMWTKFTWTGMNDIPAYGSNWSWPLT